MKMSRLNFAWFDSTPRPCIKTCSVGRNHRAEVWTRILATCISFSIRYIHPELQLQFFLFTVARASREPKYRPWSASQTRVSNFTPINENSFRASGSCRQRIEFLPLKTAPGRFILTRSKEQLFTDYSAEHQTSVGLPDK